MANDISVLMDGELDAESASRIIARLNSSEDLRQHWSTYHLIGDTLRKHIECPVEISHRLSEKLSLEPTVLAPRRPAAHKVKVFALSAAAAVAAVGIVAWVALQNSVDRTSENIAVRQQAVQAARLVSAPLAARMNDYLIAHQEFSPSTAIQGVAPYVRTVTDTQSETTR